MSINCDRWCPTRLLLSRPAADLRDDWPKRGSSKSHVRAPLSYRARRSRRSAKVTIDRSQPWATTFPLPGVDENLEMAPRFAVCPTHAADVSDNRMQTLHDHEAGVQRFRSRRSIREATRGSPQIRSIDHRSSTPRTLAADMRGISLAHSPTEGQAQVRQRDRDRPCIMARLPENISD